MVLSEFLSDHFLEHTKRTQPIATRKKPAKCSVKEASAFLQIKTPSDGVQQTNPPADHGESTVHFRFIPGWTGPFENTLYQNLASTPMGIRHVGIQ